MTTPRDPEQAAQQLTYFVEGMDCASCVQKVERMVGTLPGTGSVKTSFTKQTLTLTLDEDQTSRSTLEKNLRSLGYTPSALARITKAVKAPSPTTNKLQPNASSHEGHAHAEHDHLHDHSHSHAHGHSHDPADLSRPWYQTGQGRLVLMSGALLALAWAVGLVFVQWAQWCFAAAALLGVWPLAQKAWASARLGDFFSINLLVSLAAVGAVAIGQAAEGAVVVFLFGVGELLEGVAASRARAGIGALAALAPKTALLLENGSTREIQASELQVGQTVQVNPGARVPADGVIVAGQSSLDESPITGESLPVNKNVGERVFAGSINTDGVLSVQVDRAASDNTISRIIQMVEDAESSRAPTARLIDRFSRWYTPGVVGVAALTAVIPPLLLGQSWHEWLYKGIALLLIGCPCALVLSVPAAITSGISAGARRGLLIKGGATLETIGSIQTIAFDKTGTLTAGTPQVTDIVGHGAGDRTEVLRLAAAIEQGSSHPLAGAIVRAAQEAGLNIPAAANARALAGKGAEAQVEGRLLAVSSPKAAQEAGVRLAESATTELEQSGKTVVVLHEGSQLLGLLALRDEARADAAAALAHLKALGIRPLMLTGDNARTAQAIGRELGLEASTEIQAELLPADKLQKIGELRGPVAMVGDGINDAPALARADVGIAMGSGTDVALETADAALLQGRMKSVPELVQLSRATMQNIRQNIAFALGLKLLFLVTTLLGYTNLWIAVLADTGATALVTANALRLLNWKPGTARHD